VTSTDNTMRAGREQVEVLVRQALSEVLGNLDAIPTLEAAAALLRAQAGELPAGEQEDLQDLADEETERTAPPEGWNRIIPPQRKSHYFVNGRSLCGRYGFPSLPLNPDDYASPDDCAACRKRLTLRQLDRAALKQGRGAGK
jgi:hypothetical protein